MDFKIQLDNLINYVEVNYMTIIYILFIIIIIVISLMISIKTLTYTTTIINRNQMSKSFKEMDFPKNESIAKIESKEDAMMAITQTPATIKNKKGQKFVDMSREMKDLMTELVVNEFFQDKAQLYNFLNDISVGHNEAISQYISEKNLNQGDILFLFKGGNVLRMVSNEFIYQLPSNVAEQIKLYYKPMFKRSDADFGIYIHPNAIKQVPHIYDDMSQLSYNVQYELRERFSTEPSRYFSFMIKSDEEKQKILNKYLDRAKKTNMLNDPENTTWYGVEIQELNFNGPDGKYEGVNDKLIKFGKNEDTIEILPKEHNGSLVKPHPIYINDNRALKFCKQEESCTTPINFNLTRSKINFTLTTSKGNVNVGGELIDVSVGKDDNTKHFFDDLNNNIASYTLKLDDNELKFLSYSINYLANDIERIIFTDTNYSPWKDNKYEKRVNRLLFLGFLEEFALKSDNNTLLSTIKRIQDNLLNNKVNFVENYNGKIWKRIFEYTEKVQNNSSQQKKEYDAYIKTLYNNFDNFQNILYKLNIYINEQGAIVPDDFYKSTADNLI